MTATNEEVEAECDDCGYGPDVTEHECWCETGHQALVAEVRRLRAALEAASGGKP